MRNSKWLRLVVLAAALSLGGLIASLPITGADPGQPDLVVRNIVTQFVIEKDADLIVTVYIENIGNASVKGGFYVELWAAAEAGFWQTMTSVSAPVYVEPPIGAGEVRALEILTVAGADNQMNLRASLDTTGVIAESDESNNTAHVSRIAVAADTCSPPVCQIDLAIPVTNPTLSQGIFIMELTEESWPDVWGGAKAPPGGSITLPAGGSADLPLTIKYPADTILSPIVRLEPQLLHAGLEYQFVDVMVITTPLMGLYFDPYANELQASGVDQINSDCVVDSEILSKNGAKVLTKYTVTNDRGYISAIVEMVSAKHLNRFKITEIDYNGDVTIIPEPNMFLTTFNLDHDGELRNFHQNLRFNSEMRSSTHYNVRDDQTGMVGELMGETIVVTFGGLDTMAVRLRSGVVGAYRKTTDCISHHCYFEPITHDCYCC